MRKKVFTLLVAVFVYCSTGLAQQAQSFEECSKHLPVKQKIRVSSAVIEEIVQKIVGPDASDLQSIKNTDVKVKILIDQAGAVVCAVGMEGNATLYERSVDAAHKWKFRPYLIEGKPTMVESWFLFHYNKGKVSSRFPRS